MENLLERSIGHTRRWVSTAALTFAASAAGGADPRDTFDIVQLADGVYAAVEHSRIAGVFRSNTTFVIGGDGVLVVDSDGWPSRASAVIDEIAQRTDLPVRYLVNTHYGPDHVRGNRLYAQRFPGVVIVSHPATREEIVENGVALVRFELEDRLATRVETARRELAAGVDRSGNTLTQRRRQEFEEVLRHHTAYRADLEALDALRPPDLVFEERMTLHLGEQVVELIALRGHSRGDVAVYLPQQKVLVAGDLVVSDRPFSAIESPRAHQEALESLAALDFEILVPGHGSLQRGREMFDLVRALATSLVEQVEAAVAVGASLEETRQQVRLSELRRSYLARLPDLEVVFDLTYERVLEAAYREEVARARAANEPVFPVTPTLFIDEFEASEGITFNAEGQLFIGANRAVWRAEPDGRVVRLTEVYTHLGMAAIGDRDILAADFGPTNVFQDGPNDDGIVWRITPEGDKRVVATGIADPNFILVLEDGSFLVSRRHQQDLPGGDRWLREPLDRFDRPPQRHGALARWLDPLCGADFQTDRSGGVRRPCLGSSS